MIVQRGAGVLEDGDVQEALQADLQDAQAAVHDEHDGRQQEGEGMAALQRQDRDEEAHGTAAGIAHQQAGGLCVGPQVGQQRTHEHDTCGAVVTQLLLIGQQVGADGHNGHAGGQAVHTVGAVDHVDAGPDQDDDQQQVHGIRQREAPLQELHPAAVEVQVGDTGHDGDHKINDALLVLVPGGLGGIVEVAGEHGRDEQHRVDDILHLERQECQRHQRDAQHEDQAGAAGLALGQAAVDRKLAAVVMGKFIVEYRIHQSREDKGQQERQSVHAALPHDRKQHFDHLQNSSFFCCCERSVSRCPEKINLPQRKMCRRLTFDIPAPIMVY